MTFILIITYYTQFVSSHCINISHQLTHQIHTDNLGEATYFSGQNSWMIPLPSVFLNDEIMPSGQIGKSNLILVDEIIKEFWIRKANDFV